MIFCGERPFKQRTKDGMTLAPMKSGRYVLRMKSSLSGKRVKRDPKFAPLMKDAGWMQVASPLAAGVYREMGVKDVGVYRKMVGRAKGMLKEGMREGEVEEVLRREFGGVEQQPERKDVLRKVKVIPRFIPILINGYKRRGIHQECLFINST